MTRRPPLALRRRSLLASGLGIPASGLLASCTSFDEKDGGTSTPARRSEPAAEWEPVTVEHRYGETRLWFAEPLSDPGAA